MAATQYVGAHYVPHGWEEWNPNTYYDGLFCVSYNYSWFIAKQNVPVGISPVNTEYWAPYSLTTGAQQELVDLVNRYEPQHGIPEGTDFNRILNPGNYYLVGGRGYLNAPFNNNHGSMSVRKISDTSDNVIQLVRQAGEYPLTYQRQVGSLGATEWFVMENPRALEYYNFNGSWINNVDVFNTIVSESKTKWYKFGTGCSNTPSMNNYFTVIQTGGQAFAFGGVGSKNTVAMAYWASESNRWTGWQNFGNTNFMESLAFNHMIKVGTKSKTTTPYEYTIYLRNGYDKRFSGLLMTNNSGGGGRIDFIWANNNGNLSTHQLTESGISYRISLNNSGIVITSEDPYLDLVMISTGQSYGAGPDLNNFNFKNAPYSLV